MSDVRSYRWYADGNWRDAPGLFDDFEPHSGAVYARAPTCGAVEAKIAVTAAHAAFPKAAQIFRRRREEIAEILVRETGNTLLFSLWQQELAATALKQAANWVFLPKGEVLASNLPNTPVLDDPVASWSGIRVSLQLTCPGS